MTTGAPDPVNQKEIDQVTDAVKQLDLKFVVITSPARDDLKDGGAQQFYDVTQNILKTLPDTQVELLVPDFHNVSNKFLNSDFSCGFSSLHTIYGVRSDIQMQMLDMTNTLS